VSWSSRLNISPQSFAVVCNLAVTVFWPTHDRVRGMRNFHKLTIWQKAHELALEIYRTTDAVTAVGEDQLIDQMRSAAISIAGSIANGSAYPSDEDFARYLDMAVDTASELEILISLARDLELIPESACDARRKETVELRAMLWAFMKRPKNVRPELN
jgi:four helix bundle protein